MTRLLGFVVKAFVPGVGWQEDTFVLEQAAVECARRNSGEVYRCTREEFWGEWIDDEVQTLIWPPEKVGR